MEAEWLVIPFDRAVQVAACSIIGSASISVREYVPQEPRRHREERSDEAIQTFFAAAFWIASLRSQ